MHKEDPPVGTPRPGERRNKFSDIVSTLLSEPGTWWNITDDINELGATGKPATYFGELARSIGAGNRAGFKPRGHFQGRASGTNIWARAVPEDEREEVAAEAEAAEADTAENVNAHDHDLEPAF